MIIYKVLTDLRSIIVNGTNDSVGEVCLMVGEMWNREYYTKEDFIVGFIKRS